MLVLSVLSVKNERLAKYDTKTRYDKNDLLLPFNSSRHPLSAEYHEAYVWGQNVAQIILNYANFPHVI